jgi:excinuclease UvrABC nuclease subunit
MWGPIEDKHAAGKLVETIEDCFDLCRYYNVLVESPRGRACAYKEMGKCPAPCDGTVPMEHYHGQIRRGLEMLERPSEFADDLERRMREAAGRLEFEAAKKFKGLMERTGQLRKGAFRHGRMLEDFRYVSFQKGPRAGTVKMFLITPGDIEEVAALIGDPAGGAADMLRYVLAMGEHRRGNRVDEFGAERIAVVANHLFSAKSTQGVFVHLDELEEKSLIKAYRDVLKQKAADETEEEGAMKELQAM